MTIRPTIPSQSVSGFTIRSASVKRKRLERADLACRQSGYSLSLRYINERCGGGLDNASGREESQSQGTRETHDWNTRAGRRAGKGIGECEWVRSTSPRRTGHRPYNQGGQGTNVEGRAGTSLREETGEQIQFKEKNVSAPSCLIYNPLRTGQDKGVGILKHVKWFGLLHDCQTEHD